MKEVELPKEAPMEDREYFNLALLENDNWKLHKLPDLYEDLTNISTYFNYAHHVRNSLKELSLARGMIGIGEFGRLADFKR